MLETIREYAMEQLADTDEMVACTNAHTAWCLNLAEQAAPFWFTPDQVAWADRLEADHDNLRAALGRAMGEGSTLGGSAVALLVYSRSSCRRICLAGVGPFRRAEDADDRARPRIDRGILLCADKG